MNWTRIFTVLFNVLQIMWTFFGFTKTDGLAVEAKPKHCKKAPNGKQKSENSKCAMGAELRQQLQELQLSPTFAEDKKLSGKLKDIIKNKIKMNDDVSKQNKCVLEAIKSTFIAEMKQIDPLFNELFNEVYHTGSSYSNLRVSEPNEFDLDFILKFPFSYNDYKVITKGDVHPSFAKIQLKKSFSQTINATPKEKILFPMNKWFNDNNFLKNEAPLRWINGLVDTVLPKIKNSIRGVRKISRHTSGPAITLVAETENDEISIDFVPVFKFKENVPSPGDLNRVVSKTHKVEERDKFWFIVPKTVKNDDITNNEKAVMWRIDYPEVEKKLIHDVGCVKLVIKLLKLFRDRNKVKVASYHLKTLLMLEVIQHPQSDYWAEAYLGPLFMIALQKLAEVLEKHYLPFIFDNEANLFEGRISPGTAKNFSGLVKSCIKDIRKDPNNLNKCFKL